MKERKGTKDNRNVLTNFRMTRGEKRTLQELARARGVTMSALLRAHIRALASQTQQEKVA